MRQSTSPEALVTLSDDGNELAPILQVTVRIIPDDKNYTLSTVPGTW